MEGSTNAESSSERSSPFGSAPRMRRAVTVASEPIRDVGRFLHALDDLSDIHGKALFQSVASSTTKPTAWRPFSDEEDELLQKAWWSFNAETREKAIKASTPEARAAAKTKALEDKKKRPEGQVIAEPDAPDQPHLVPVGLDRLFDVNLLTLELSPVFWQGQRVDVQYGTWFMPSSSAGKYHPVEPLVAEALEAAYQDVKPWTAGFEDELRSAVAQGGEAEAKLKVELKEQACDVLFQSAEHARLYPHSLTSRLSKSIWTTILSRNQHAGGTLVVRGYQAASEWREREKGGANGSPSRSGSRPSTPQRKRHGSNASEATINKDESTKRNSETVSTGAASKLASLLKRGEPPTSPTADGQEAPAENTTTQALKGDHRDGQPTPELAELVLVYHGIGQRLADYYESFRFVHAINDLRALCTKHSMDEQFKSLVGNRRLQFIPVQWRSSLVFPHERDPNDKDALNAGENRFTLEDIDVKDSGIPFARQLVGNIILDFPLYMSSHGSMMVEAVVKDSNNIYRLFCKRNPQWKGKVSLIGHSLGSALAMDVLSKQPTFVKPITEQSSEEQRTKEHFVFNTHALFMLGSPVSFLFSLHNARLIARRGRGRTANAPEDVSSDKPKYGCPAVDDLYNIYCQTDPIAYCVNAVVDARHARFIPPIAMPSQTSTLFATIGESLSRALAALPNPFHGYGTSPSNNDLKEAADDKASGKPRGEAEQKVEANIQTTEKLKSHKEGNETPQRPSIGKLPTLMRLPSGESLTIEQFRAAQKAGARFKALNPSGSIDYFLPSESYSSYLDMLYSHASYWADPRFSSFLITQLLSSAGNLERAREVQEETGPLSRAVSP